MKPEDFVHLHVHSHYSALDGCITVDKLLDRARSLGMKALALTDHGTLSGAIDFYRKARQGDRPVKPIIGVEAYAAEWMKRLLPVSSHKLIARQLRGAFSWERDSD